MIVEMDWSGFKDLVVLNKDHIIVFAKVENGNVLFYTNINNMDIVCQPSSDLYSEVEEFMQQNNVVRVKDIKHGWQVIDSGMEL